MSARAIRWDAGKVVAVGVIGLVVPELVTGLDGRFTATTAVLYAILAVSWNLTLGTARIFNFAHIAFFALGAYASAIITTKLPVSPWVGLAVATGVGVVAGAAVFIPAVRLRGIYVALTTFVLAQVCFYVVLGLTSFTGGSNGVVGLPQYQIGNYLFVTNGDLGYYYLGLILLVATLGVMVAIKHARLGRGLVALRDNEIYALTRGVPAFRLRLAAFCISGGIAAVTGAVYAHLVGVVSPDLFGFNYISLVLSMIVLGGTNSIFGPVAGAVVIEETLNRLRSQGAWQFIVVSAVILGVLWFFPGGLAGIPERLRGLRRRRTSFSLEASPVPPLAASGTPIEVEQRGSAAR
jgi:branched-chain amino acid transport system permease protein